MVDYLRKWRKLDSIVPYPLFNMNFVKLASFIHLFLIPALGLGNSKQLPELNPNHTVLLPPISNISESFILLNGSTAAINKPLRAGFDIQCDWERFGIMSTASDCETAWQNWSPDTIDRLWVQRLPGRPEAAYALPLMTMGSRLAL